MSKYPSKMRIAIIGVGAIGSGLAFKLAGTGGHDVTVIARPGSARLKQLEQEGAIITHLGERAEVYVADALDEQIPYDIVIVTIQAHLVGPILPTLHRSAAKRILCLFFVYNPEALRDAIGPERAVFGMPTLQGKLDPSTGVLTYHIPSRPTLVGEESYVEVFNAAGLRSAFEPKILLWLRCNTPFCMAMESVSFAGLERGGGATWKQCTTAARGLKESLVLIKRSGHQLYPSFVAIVNRSPVPVAALPLYFVTRVKYARELFGAAVLESRALIDAVAEAASEARPPVDKALIKAMKLAV